MSTNPMKWTADDQGVLKMRRATRDGYKFRVIAGYSPSEDLWAYNVAVTPPDGREVNLPSKGQKAPTMEAAFAAAEAIAEAYPA
ncbi:MAG: hypothetical protein EOO28_15950 [Comamonadaceae bacterium]|nr:MAG: hypothetical protein EOO28_15950 [Comamonadaceae bacterium]